MKSFIQTGGVENKSSIIHIIKGVVISYFITLVLLFLFSLLLTYTNVAENMIAPAILIITIISILIGGSIGSSKIKKKGLIHGGMIGIIYISILYFISSFIHTGFAMNIYAILMILFSVLAGMVRRNCWSKLKKIIDKEI